MLLWLVGVLFVTFVASQIRLAGLAREDGQFEYLANPGTRKVMLVITAVGTCCSAVLMGVVIYRSIQLQVAKRRRSGG